MFFLLCERLHEFTGLRILIEILFHAMISCDTLHLLHFLKRLSYSKINFFIHNCFSQIGFKFSFFSIVNHVCFVTLSLLCDTFYFKIFRLLFLFIIQQIDVDWFILKCCVAQFVYYFFFSLLYFKIFNYFYLLSIDSFLSIVWHILYFFFSLWTM